MKRNLEGHKIKIGNLSLFYYTCGVGPPLFFLHGHRSDTLRWEKIILFLGQYFQVFSPDLPGFGRSPQLKTWHTMDRYAEIMTQFMKKMRFKDATIIGGSMGGIIAIKMLACHHLSCQRLVLLETPYDKSYYKMGNFRVGLILAALKLAVLSRVIPKIADWLFSSDTFLYKLLERSFAPEDRTKKIIEFEMHQWRVMKIRVWMETLYDVLNVNFGHENFQINIPTWLVVSKNDCYLKVEPTVLGFKKIFPQCQTIFLSLKAHVPKGEFSSEQIRALYPLFRSFFLEKIGKKEEAR
jgi:pimeloyl-ACP methyl ester carboxylesterase